jgi:hypothetical protein
MRRWLCECREYSVVMIFRKNIDIFLNRIILCILDYYNNFRSDYKNFWRHFSAELFCRCKITQIFEKVFILIFRIFYLLIFKILQRSVFCPNSQSLWTVGAIKTIIIIIYLSLNVCVNRGNRCFCTQLLLICRIELKYKVLGYRCHSFSLFGMATEFMVWS